MENGFLQAKKIGITYLEIKKVLSENYAPNKACSGLVGLGAVFKPFSGFGFFPLPSRIHAHPQAANANR